MGKITFISNQQAHHVEIAKQLTGSEGFMHDARAIAAYLPGETAMDLLCVAVFECFRGGRADLHLGCAPGKRLTPEVITLDGFTGRLAGGAVFVGHDLRTSETMQTNVNNWLFGPNSIFGL